jgi:hypothetical protein
MFGPPMRGETATSGVASDSTDSTDFVSLAPSVNFLLAYRGTNDLLVLSREWMGMGEWDDSW